MGATDRIIFDASQSQVFVDDGRYPRTDGGVTVSFDIATRRYFATSPGNTEPEPLQRDPRFTPAAGAPWTNFVLPYGVYFMIRASGAFPDDARRYFSSNLAGWGGSDFSGVTAFGIPTPPDRLPQQGSVLYSGFLEGASDERYASEGATYFAGIRGLVTLTLDFTNATATITIVPTLDLAQPYSLPAISGLRLVLPRGTATFHQPVPGNPQSRAYPLSGRLTGPAGQEMIGGVELEYVSPIDGKAYRAGGAFIAKIDDPSVPF